jgi:hypothetical protein
MILSLSGKLMRYRHSPCGCVNWQIILEYRTIRIFVSNGLDGAYPSLSADLKFQPR